MTILERDDQLDELESHLDAARRGGGLTVLVYGEAGIGKTALVEAFVRRVAGRARILEGACDPLFTPRPLGPLHDIAAREQGGLAELLEQGAARERIFAAFLEEISRGEEPVLVVFEDVHWADEATLDLVRFLSRRIGRAHCLLLLTYRPDELGGGHPLRLVIGEMPGGAVRRLPVPPLSRDAVAALAGERDRPAASLHEITGGNPFFVTELLSNEGEAIPATVVDAVRARVARLSQPARAVVELVCVSPARLEVAVIEDILGPGDDSLDECLESGVLHSDGQAVAFRHELARLAVEESLTAARARSLHARLLEALEPRRDQAGLARLVHHAAKAGIGDTVLELAPLAAQQAAAFAAHREAAKYYGEALRYADSLPADRRAGLLEGRSYECYLTDRLEEALAARREAYDLWRGLGDAERQGASLRWLSRLSWFRGLGDDAARFAREAVDALEPIGPSAELAMAYSNLAQLHMLAGDVEQTRQWGDRAIGMATDLDDKQVLAHALNNVGTVLLRYRSDGEGKDALARSLALSLDNGYDEHAARAYTNLGTALTATRRYAEAREYLEAGIAYCTERDLDSWRLYMQAWLAQLHLEQGRYDEAGDLVGDVLRSFRVSTITRIPALLVLGWLRVRRADPDAMTPLDAAVGEARRTGELQRVGPIAVARAEAAWLQGDLPRCLAETDAAYELALQHAEPWLIGQLAYWRWRAGALREAPANAAEPYRSQISGEWRSAATAWERIGCPYEQAQALADGDAPAQFAALEILNRLGATAAADRLTRTMRAAGIRNLPRGPREETRRNPAALTTRQMQVLGLLAEGLQNAEIAERLFISAKTVDHHISAILSKLEVPSRIRAVAEAARLGILPQK